MRNRILQGLLIFLWPVLTQHTFTVSANYFVVWNVGQGLWTSYIDAQTCLHFDSGGEFAPSQKIRSLCEHRENIHLLSHYDWDHMSFVNNIRFWPKTCRVGWPSFDQRKNRQVQYLKLTACEINEAALLRKFKVAEVPQGPPKYRKNINSNEASRVFVLKNIILAPGDSPSSREKFWDKKYLKNIQVLILGHHGSQTSTGNDLLFKLPRLKLAIASSRKSRYGHPHQTVVKKLRDRLVPLISTEDWGNIWIEIK